MNDPFADLGRLEDHVWARLAKGSMRSDDAFRFAVLATTGVDGPEARMMVVRRVDRVMREIELHSDLRTAKVRMLRIEPRAALLFWDAETRMQVRLSVAMRVVTGDPDRWLRIPVEARRNYGTDPAPGMPVGDPDGVTRSAEIARFGALVGDVRCIDTLSLAHEPHRRARFDPAGATWVAP